jgi:tetratricopeptide (TPR) repeat protein
MGKTLQFPVQAAHLGYRRARRRRREAEDPGQLKLFELPTAGVLSLADELGYFDQALLFDEHGDARALELCQKAVEVGDRIADACCNLGILLSNAGETAKALDYFTRSLKHDPRHAESHFNLGNLYFEVNDFTLARIHYEVAVEIDSTFANALFNLALTHTINRDLTAATKVLARYRPLVSDEEAHEAELMLRRSWEGLNRR